jgi:hypothetical protein
MTKHTNDGQCVAVGHVDPVHDVQTSDVVIEHKTRPARTSVSADKIQHIVQQETVLDPPKSRFETGFIAPTGEKLSLEDVTEIDAHNAAINSVTSRQPAPNNEEVLTQTLADVPELSDKFGTVDVTVHAAPKPTVENPAPRTVNIGTVKIDYVKPEPLRLASKLKSATPREEVLSQDIQVGDFPISIAGFRCCTKVQLRPRKREVVLTISGDRYVLKYDRTVTVKRPFRQELSAANRDEKS